jgi:hypothetical protein
MSPHPISITNKAWSNTVARSHERDVAAEFLRLLDRRWTIRELAAVLDLKVVQVAAGLGPAGDSRGAETSTTPDRDGRTSRPGSAGRTTLNSSEVCSRPTGWTFGRKPDRDPDDTAAGGFGT